MPQWKWQGIRKLPTLSFGGEAREFRGVDNENPGKVARGMSPPLKNATPVRNSR